MTRRGRAKHRTGARQPTESPAGYRVLVVDDDPLGRKLVALRLRDQGFVVQTSAAAEEALRIAMAAPPAAILSDVLMPRIDGFQLCRGIRRDPRLARIPVVLLSSAVGEEDRDRALDAGADGIFVRTPDMREALDALAHILGQAVHADNPTTD